MSPDVTPPPDAWAPLPPVERRVLGVLVEKQKTSKTADSYPLTLNALTTGCNQKSNRDPVLDLSEFEVEDALAGLQKKSLVTRITGGRVERFRHELYDRWTRNGPQLAVLAELLLRGPQTKGELRGRAARMDPIDTLDQLDEILKPLIERMLVVWLTEPDRRGAVLTHGFHSPDEIPGLKAHATTAPSATQTPATVLATPAPRGNSDTGPDPHALAALEARLTDAVEEIARLKAAVAALEAHLADLRKQLGVAG
jgi:uncharacterized protein YceH (UPF0502 family)